jgi:DNA-binding beta-propeller fold protein YncE
VGEIDVKSNKIVAQVPVGTRPAQLVFGSGSLWAVNQGDNTVSRIDPMARRQIRVTPVDAVATGMAAAKKSVWVTTDNGIKAIDPAFDEQPGTCCAGTRGRAASTSSPPGTARRRSQAVPGASG